ncbi:decarboxylating NADP(+)-dependent phosphogluconate dehydrogenase [Pseudomonadales bacterium]|nr:decarboxylating NADP(+)-dependent phosphogluconate dehydrogenase [Pseudomonadales bacterium]MDB9879493.1 decarboxylating NADP(+)-dependent phosphogluconate dehydrogenase [Pseudomonadales bacterium]MDB9917727.1 decarboxylating NADP(+)-dependent phosphogluconate dehydrogenase [Pseudomonadales bacterium]MDC1368513.1 decarboxylating NADP(+)-dependent phosphogluconate dehydrogenase [Pseudomonadales bacterium]
MLKVDIGLIGLAVMGQNLALNMNDHGFTVAVFNRSVTRVDEFLAGSAKGTKIIGAHSIENLVAGLRLPRRVMMMVKAGDAVDSLIEQLLPHLSPGDILIDGGNELFTNTSRRALELASQGILYVGTGISGGEEGARLGPSIMPGGNPDAWPQVQEIFQAIAARVDDQPCCDWIGSGGAGHYVKMVHNGIEYGDMQLIGEAYDFMRRGMGLSQVQMAAVFGRWNTGVLDSYLIEITAKILDFVDDEGPTLVRILDRAGQKGTGKWAGINALELGIPLTLIGESVFARCLSAMKEERLKAAEFLHGPNGVLVGEAEEFTAYLHDALYAAKIMSYAQGYMLMREAAKEYGWQLNYGSISLLWRGGCIIRSAFLGDIKRAFDNNPALENLLLDEFFRDAINQAQSGWRKVVGKAAEMGIPTPGFSAALAYYDGYRSASLPANLLQAQRDYFGAHTYERTDRPRGQMFHTDWAGKRNPKLDGQP